MMKYAIAVTAAALSCAPEAAGRSILQKLDWNTPVWNASCPLQTRGCHG
jgi:hypothetical protein